MIKDSPATTGTRPRRGRPPATTPHEIQLAALDLFQRNGYERNPVARRTGVVGRLIADIDEKMQRGAQAAGSKELASAAD